MKKFIALLTVLVIVLTCTSILLVACDNNKDAEESITANNSETLVSAAVLASSMGIGEAASAAEEETTDFEAGIDLSLSFEGYDISAAFEGTALTLMDTVVGVFSEPISSVLNASINTVSATIGNNSIQIEKAEDSDNVYYATLKTVTEENEEVKEIELKFRVTISIADGKNIDSKEFTYSLKVELFDEDEYEVIMETSGSASYSDAKDAIEFVFGENRELIAYATKEGAINIEFTLAADDIMTCKAAISLKDGVANIDASIVLNGYGEAEANINVGIGADFKEYSISGTFKGVILVPEEAKDIPLLSSLLPESFNAEGNINGIAKYVADDEMFEVGLKGNVALSTTQQEEAK